MSKIEMIKKQITEMDVKSDDFFEIYQHVADKYYSFKDPDIFQESLAMVHQWLDKSGGGNWEDQVIVVASVVKEVFMMRTEKRTSCTGTLGFKDETFFFDIYTAETEKDKMGELIKNAHSAMEKGNFTVKDKHGKRYFNKKSAQ